MNNEIKAIETEWNGYRFRSRLEARWAVFFSAVGLEYQYETEGFDMDGIRYLPDFYIPSLNRWFEVKGKPLSVEEMKKCEEFCFRKDKYNIKFSILVGTPRPCIFEDDTVRYMGIEEFTWEWPSKNYPENYRMQAPKELIQEDYFSRFVRGIWVVPDIGEEELLDAVKKARGARFEFGEKPSG